MLPTNLFRYGDPYVIHLNSFLGKLFLYQIQGEKVNLQEPAITIPSESNNQRLLLIADRKYASNRSLYAQCDG